MLLISKLYVAQTVLVIPRIIIVEHRQDFSEGGYAGAKSLFLARNSFCTEATPHHTKLIYLVGRGPISLLA